MDFDAIYAESNDPWSHHLRISLKEYDQRYLRILKQHIKNSSTILEIACGDGHFSEKLANHFVHSKIDACDISTKAVEIAKKRFGSIVNFFVDKIPVLENLDQKYDLIILNEALSYLNDKDRELAVSRIRDLSKSGGYFFISSNIGRNYFQEDELISLIELCYGKIVHFERNYNLIYYKIVEVPLLALISVINTMAKKYPWMKIVTGPVKFVFKYLLKNRLLFQMLQMMSKLFLGRRGITNIYILALRNE